MFSFCDWTMQLEMKGVDLIDDAHGTIEIHQEYEVCL